MDRSQLLHALAKQLEWPGLDESTRLADDARWDSVAQLEVLMVLQRDHGVAVSAEQLQSSATMRDVLNLALAAGD